MAKYRINYKNTIRQAGEIRKLGNTLNKQITSLRNHLKDVSNGWEGPAAEEYEKQVNTLISKMSKTKTSITTLASNIEAAAINIKREDERLAEAAKEKNSSEGGGSSRAF